MKDKREKMAEDAGVDMSKYILKSEVVPPVCPKISTQESCPRQNLVLLVLELSMLAARNLLLNAKKVPNYRAASVSNVLPLPRLNSFAAFN